MVTRCRCVRRAFFCVAFFGLWVLWFGKAGGGRTRDEMIARAPHSPQHTHFTLHTYSISPSLCGFTMKIETAFAVAFVSFLFFPASSTSLTMSSLSSPARSIRVTVFSDLA